MDRASIGGDPAPRSLLPAGPKRPPGQDAPRPALTLGGLERTEPLPNAASSSSCPSLLPVKARAFGGEAAVLPTRAEDVNAAEDGPTAAMKVVNSVSQAQQQEARHRPLLDGHVAIERAPRSIFRQFFC